MSKAEYLPYFTEQLLAHPALLPQDGWKLCYQSVFGAEHLVNDPEGMEAYFHAEYARAKACSGPLREDISPEQARVSLCAWKAAGLPPEWLFRLFLYGARHPLGKGDFHAAAEAFFEAALGVRGEAYAAACRAFFEKTEQGGIRPVRHTEAYRAAEQPAYRLVPGRYLRLLPVLERVNAVLTPEKGCVIAVDGRCGSGKTTVSDALCFVLSAGAVRMDDFFLPPQKRTPERLAEPGGNVDSERFSKEVLPFLRDPGAFAYRAFDCEAMAMGESRAVPAGTVRVVEGSYSCHPCFGRYADITVFSDISPKEQRKRIEARNGAYAPAFFTRWIPMEERYFTAFRIRESADILLDNG